MSSRFWAVANKGKRTIPVTKVVKRDFREISVCRFMIFEDLGFSLYQRLKGNHANF